MANTFFIGLPSGESVTVTASHEVLLTVITPLLAVFGESRVYFSEADCNGEFPEPVCVALWRSKATPIYFTLEDSDR